MMKKLATIIPILLLSLLCFAQTATADIQHFNWINPTAGEDPYYDANVVAYQTGTWWNISLSIQNNYLTPPPPPRINLPVNITAIRVYFDWGKWYNYTFSTPVYMEPFEVKVFNIGNVTPPLDEAPETWKHSYTVYVEYIPQGSTTPLTDWTWSGNNFAAMSADHFTAFQLYNKLSGMMMGGGTPFMITNVTEAQVLMIKAFLEFSLGEQSYGSGSFADAKTHLQNADNYFNAALDAWNERGTAFENTMLEYYGALANATKKQADAELIQANAALNNSYGWIFFGLGWVLIGIGIIIYGAKKPKVA